ncbi:MAG: N-formylglutamate deformylase [Betaproteobacteria bacterium]|nr:N-formylglutamate deformylase [Betaproteobacteria bacterium]
MTLPIQRHAPSTGSNLFTLHRGTTPLLISFPHVGTAIPEQFRHRLVERALAVEDTDWHLERLYSFARGLGASLLVPATSRYVIDLNRPSDNQPMYPGQNNTELCPTRFFTGEPLYRPGCEPDATEIRERVATWWQPYHDALRGELSRLRDAHGHAVLFDAHSIKGELPWLFPGLLPDMNIGTVSGSACDPSLRQAVEHVFASQSAYSWVLDGRFKGGHITRSYGRPAERIHAVQLEMSWRAYMLESPPYAWHDERAQAVTPLLERLVAALRNWAPQ